MITGDNRTNIFPKAKYMYYKLHFVSNTPTADGDFYIKLKH